MVGFQCNFWQITLSFSAGKHQQLVVSNMLLIRLAIFTKNFQFSLLHLHLFANSYEHIQQIPVQGAKKTSETSQIVQSVMQDYQYDLSHLLPVCNLLVQGPKITYNYCLSRRSGLLWWFTLNFVHFKFINTLSQQTWYFLIFFNANICNLILLFSSQSL